MSVFGVILVRIFPHSEYGEMLVLLPCWQKYCHVDRNTVMLTKILFMLTKILSYWQKYCHVDKNTVLKEIKKLNLNKTVQDSDVPVKILKANADFFYLQFNEAVDSSKFADFFKSADISAAFKQGSRNKKENYRPISILPLISKIFEKIICRQLSNHFDNILSKFQCGFRKGYSPQHCLLLMIDKWKKAVDNHKVFGAVLTDLSKAFWLHLSWFTHCKAKCLWTVFTCLKTDYR